MSSINIDSGSTTPVGIPNSTDGASISSGTGASGLVSDTLSASILASEANSASVFNKLAQPTYLNVWTKIIDLAILDARHRQVTDETNDISSLRGVRLNAILTAETLLALENRLYGVGMLFDVLYQRQSAHTQTVNDGIEAYNNQIEQNTDEDQNQIDLLNAATNAYNGSDQGVAATAAYNLAINNYNAYVAGRADDYTNARNDLDLFFTNYVTATEEDNEFIDAINTNLEEAGLPLLSPISTTPPSVPGQPAMPAAPSPANAVLIGPASVPNPVDTIAPPSAPPSGTDLVNQNLSTLINAVIPTLVSNTEFYNQLSAYREFQRFYLGPLAGQVSYLPNAFTDRNAEVFLDKSTGIGSGSGVSLTSMIAGLSQGGHLDRLLSNQLANDAFLQAGIPLSPHLLDEIRLINLSLLSRANVGASIPAFSLLAERLAFITPQSPAVQIAASAAVLNQIAGLSTSDDLKDAILKRLQSANLDADEAKLNELATALAAASNASLVLFGVSQLAQALNAPDLTAKFLGLSDNEAVSKTLQSASLSTVQDTLNNPFSVAYLKKNVQDGLLGLGTYSESTAQGIAKGLQLGQIKNEAEFKKTITDQLSAKGVQSDQAASVAGRAASFLQAEINTGHVLDTAVQREVIEKGRLSQELLKQGVSPDLAASLAADVAGGSYSSRRQLRDALTDRLSPHFSFDQAIKAASTIVQNEQSFPSLEHSRVSESQLAAEISARVIDQASGDFGHAPASGLANQLVSTLFGNEQSRPFSIANSIQRNIDALHTSRDESLVDQFRTFLKPHYDLFTFNQKMMDPANTLIHSMWTGIMYSSKFKHTESVDILV